MKVYYVEFDSCKDGVTYSLEQTVEAVDIYDAMEIVENYCCDNYGTCEIKKIEEINNE